MRCLLLFLFLGSFSFALSFAHTQMQSLAFELQVFCRRRLLPFSSSSLLATHSSHPYFGLWLVSKRRRRLRCRRRSFAVALFCPGAVLKGGFSKGGFDVDLSQFLFCSRT